MEEKQPTSQRKLATVKSLKAFLKCSTRFLFSRSFLRLQLESPRVFSPCAGLPSCNWRRKSTVTQVGDENSSSSNSPCFSHVVVIFISVRESLFYGIMQAGKKLRIVYIGELAERSVRKCFDRLHLLTCIWSDQELIKSWFVIQQFNLLMFSWSIISVVSQSLHLLDFSCAECSLC